MRKPFEEPTATIELIDVKDVLCSSFTFCGGCPEETAEDDPWG